MRKAPCKDCTNPDKKPGCHDKCDIYLTWKAGRDHIREQIYKDKQLYPIWSKKTEARIEGIRRK